VPDNLMVIGKEDRLPEFPFSILHSPFSTL
jgi:hypothetical protein